MVKMTQKIVGYGNLKFDFALNCFVFLLIFYAFKIINSYSNTCKLDICVFKILLVIYSGMFLISWYMDFFSFCMQKVM